MIRLEFRGLGVELWQAPINNRELGEFVTIAAKEGRMTERLFPQPTEH